MYARRLRVLTVVLWLVGTSALSGRQNWSTMLSEMLDRAETTYSEAGYKLSREAETGSLNQLGAEDVWIDLVGDRDYVLVGVCDVDCSDLDLEVFDAAGHEVDSDLQADDVPIVEVSARTNGRYRVSVSMIECAIEPCYYGFGILERRGKAPSEWEQVVLNQLDAFAERMEEKGYHRTHGYRTGSLDQGESSTFMVRLQAGTTYGVAGFCDGDCSDVDIHILAGDDMVVEDVATDDYPAVDFDVTATGVFTIKVSMPGCSSEPCYWGVALEGKRTES